MNKIEPRNEVLKAKILENYANFRFEKIENFGSIQIRIIFESQVVKFKDNGLMSPHPYEECHSAGTYLTYADRKKYTILSESILKSFYNNLKKV